MENSKTSETSTRADEQRRRNRLAQRRHRESELSTMHMNKKVCVYETAKLTEPQEQRANRANSSSSVNANTEQRREAEEPSGQESMWGFTAPDSTFDASEQHADILSQFVNDTAADGLNTHEEPVDISAGSKQFPESNLIASSERVEQSGNNMAAGDHGIPPNLSLNQLLPSLRRTNWSK